MNTKVRRKLEMAARVREFCRAHPSTDTAFTTVFGQLEEHLNQAEVIAARQQAGRTAERGARARRQTLREVVHFQLLRYLVTVGGVAAKDRAELAAQFRLPSSNLTNRSYLTSVKALLAAAEPLKDTLVAKGMSATLLDDLGRMVTEFEAATESARTGRRDHIRARADLDLVTEQLLQDVKLLEGVYRYRSGSDAEFMLEWDAVRQIPGLPQPRVEPEPASDGQVPPLQSGAAPAA